MPNHNNRGIMLFIVLGVIMVLALLSTVIMRVVSNQSRLTHHQVSRIQAMYAAKAGVIYALDKLRRNDVGWTSNLQFLKTMCQSGCDVNDLSLPPSIQRVDITVGALNSGVVPRTRIVSARVTYSYVP